MKKSILTLAVAALAVCAHSATLTWGVSQVLSSSDNTQPGSDYLGLFFIVDETSNPAVTVDSITSLLDSNKAAEAAALATYSKTTNASGVINSTKNGNYAAGTTVTGFAVILDANTAATANNYIITGTLTRTAGSSGAISYAFGSQSGATYKPVSPVPEPATGALALAGVALLFRRRRA